MVLVEEVVDDLTPWEERLRDAEEIEQAAAALKRPTARMQLESLAKRLRKESQALQRVEQSKQQQAAATDMDEKKEDGVTTMNSGGDASPPPTPTASSSTSANLKPEPMEVEKKQAASPPIVSSSVKYVSIDRFAFDAGGYNAAFVSLYVDLPAVGSIPRENVECNFTKGSFDLIVKDLRGKSYRLFKDMLEKDIDPGKSKIVIKADKIIVKLAKVKQSDYGGFDYWSKLTDTKKTQDKEDPSKSIMGLMKQMYDDGDDQMKKMIGETMMKQRTGELDKDKNAFMKDDF